MNHRLVGYHEGTSFLHRLSGASKLLFLLFVSLAAMLSYDTRLLLGIGVGALLLFSTARIRFRDISFVLAFALVFALLNVVMVYLFAPQYGVEIYGAKTVLMKGWGSYSITSQELFYLFNLALKYVCTIPLALIFLMTTHPSQFASSLNQIGVSYKIAYSVSLTLRYIPDVQEEYQTIKLSQEARGVELSKKAKLIKRIDSISTAMELRRFGKNKKRTWYSHQAMEMKDYGMILSALAVLVLGIVLIFVNQGRFYNPWR